MSYSRLNTTTSNDVEKGKYYSTYIHKGPEAIVYVSFTQDRHIMRQRKRKPKSNHEHKLRNQGQEAKGNAAKVSAKVDEMSNRPEVKKRGEEPDNREQ